MIARKHHILAMCKLRSFRGQRLPWLSNGLKGGHALYLYVHKNLARQPRKSVATIQSMTFHVEDVPRYETRNPYGYNEAP